MLTLLVMCTLTAAPQPLLTVSRRSGVGAPAATALAKQVSEKLIGVPLTLPLADSTNCRGKKLCLLAEARKAGATVLVTLEVSRVLDEGSLRVEALSLDEDGKSLGEVLVEGPFDGLVTQAAPRLSGPLSDSLRAALGLVPPPAPPARVDVPLVEAAAPSSVAPTAVQAAPASLSAGRIAGLTVAGAGVAALLASAAFGISAATLSSNSRALCPPEQGACSEPAAFRDYTNAARAQNASIVLAISGGAAALVGTLLFFGDPGGAKPSVALMPVEGGVFGAVGAAW